VAVYVGLRGLLRLPSRVTDFALGPECIWAGQRHNIVPTSTPAKANRNCPGFTIKPRHHNTSQHGPRRGPHLRLCPLTRRDASALICSTEDKRVPVDVRCWSQPNSRSRRRTLIPTLTAAQLMLPMASAQRPRAAHLARQWRSVGDCQPRNARGLKLPTETL
jgi:hypothetical protein